MVCKKLFLRSDWYYIGPILVCTKIKMTNRFTNTVEEHGEQLKTVVPGNRPCLFKFRETKPESQTMVDVLAAEDAGKFPDRNVTEAFSVLVA
jgi:hypothetical protein